MCNIVTEFYLYSIVYYTYLINSRLDVTFSVRHHFRIANFITSQKVNFTTDQKETKATGLHQQELAVINLDYNQTELKFYLALPTEGKPRGTPNLHLYTSKYPCTGQTLYRFLTMEQEDYLVDLMFICEFVEACVHVVEHVHHLYWFNLTADLCEAHHIAEQK